MNTQDPKYQQKSKSISSPEQNYLSPRMNFLKNNGPNFHLSAFCVWLSRDLCGSQLINAAHQHTPNLPRPWWYEFLISYKGVLNLSVNYYCGNCTMPVFNDFQILFIQRMGFNFSFEKLCVNQCKLLLWQPHNATFQINIPF